MCRVVLSGLFLFALSFPCHATAEDVLGVVVDADSVVSDVAEGDVVVSLAETVVSDAVDTVVTEGVSVEGDPMVDAVPATEPIVVVVQPLTDEEVGETVGLLKKAFNSGTWPVVVGLVIMLLVWAVRRFALKTISERWKKATPWVAAGLGLLSCVGISLSVGTMLWWRALIDGLVSGLLASGLWELIGKHVLGKGATTAK